MNQFQNTSKHLYTFVFAPLCILFLVMLLFVPRGHSAFEQETSSQGIKHFFHISKYPKKLDPKNVHLT